MSQAGLRQARARDLSGTSLDYNGDLYEAFRRYVTVPSGASWNEACTLFLQNVTGSTDTEINGLMHRYAALKGADTWQGLDKLGVNASTSPSD